MRVLLILAFVGRILVDFFKQTSLLHVDTFVILENCHKFEVNFNQDSVTVKSIFDTDFTRRFGRPGIVALYFASDLSSKQMHVRHWENAQNMKQKNRLWESCVVEE